MSAVPPPIESRKLVTFSEVDPDALPLFVDNAFGSRYSSTSCPALLTLVRALARVDAARDRKLRNCANDNDPRSDLRPV